MKITSDQFNRFQIDYIDLNPYKQRLGQYFCNYFDITDTELFYETNQEKSVCKIVYYYLDNY